MGPAILLDHMANEIFRMQSLHHNDDRIRCFVVETRQQGVGVPLQAPFSRAVSDCASCGLSGSSIMIRLPPRPVRVPPTEVARRNPRAVVNTGIMISLNGIGLHPSTPALVWINGQYRQG